MEGMIIKIGLKAYSVHSIIHVIKTMYTVCTIKA